MIASSLRSPLLLAVASVGATLVGPGLARADAGPQPPAPGGAALDQYREAIPGAIGSIVPGTGRVVARLGRRAEQRLKASGGSDTAVLKQIATSSSYGAPPAVRGNLELGVAGRSGRASELDAKGGSTGAADAAAAALGRGDRRLFALVAIMALLCVGAVAARLRGRPQPPHG